MISPSDMPARSAFMDQLRHSLQACADLPPASRLKHLIGRRMDQLPQPASGQTWIRWAALAEVAASDLSLAKLYEGHTDALAILHELGCTELVTQGSWGVWASEMPFARLRIEKRGARVSVHGTKQWCSGALDVDHGLLTAWFAEADRPQLIAVDMKQPGIEVSRKAWRAVGMADSTSLDISFDGAEAHLVGEPGDYLSRPGFWQGGAGIAACWYGGACAMGEALLRATAPPSEVAPSATQGFRLAALGRVDLALSATAAQLRVAAQWIDANPFSDAAAHALRVRLACERCARKVLDEVGRSLGATPFCRDGHFARMAADLPVFIRQSHGERDMAALGGHVALSSADATHSPWKLG